MKKNKGKARAIDHPNEDSPLLGEPSSSRQLIHTSSPSRSRIRTLLSITLIITFSLILTLLLFIPLLAYSFVPSDTEISTLPSTAFRYTPPSKIEVLDINEDGILVNITLDCGLDYDRALGVSKLNAEETSVGLQEGMRGLGADWWEELRHWTAHTAYGMLPRKVIAVTIPHQIGIHSNGRQGSLISLKLDSSLNIPLIKDVSTQRDWLQPISFTALAKPVASTGELLSFAQKAWIDGVVKVEVVVDKVLVELPSGGERWWSQYLKGEKEDLSMRIEMPVPHLPGLPSPGHSINLSSLVTLRHYNLTSTPLPSQNTTQLKIQASATITNFLRGYNITLPFGLPFVISLPDSASGEGMEMAQVLTEPVVIGSGKEIELKIAGRIVADLSTEDLEGDNSTSPLSHFFQNYLNGLVNPITVTGLSSIPPSLLPPSSKPADHAPYPPKWLLDTLPSLNLTLEFPAPPHQNLIQSITIEHMRISEAAGKMRASGVVVAEVLIPHEMGDVDIDVIGVKPDVLIFNGPVDLDSEGSTALDGRGWPWWKTGKENQDEDEKEEDYPPRAFGRIHPDYFLPSTTLPTISDPSNPDSDKTPGKRLTVRAPITNIPLDILPGRDPIFREFVSKIVFKGGGVAGISGVAGVKVEVGGVGGRLGLGGLPVRGEVWVGRGRFGIVNGGEEGDDVREVGRGV